MAASVDTVEYANAIARLVGDEFEAEVCRLLQRTFSGFQRVPRKPSGDGGIDGLSHRLTRAYCCYGLDLQPSPATTAKALRQKIVKKFTADLRRILELDGPKTSHRDNTVLEGILLPPKVKLETIYLVTNWFETNQLIGDLNGAFNVLLAKSKCRFVASQIVIWGPHDLANVGVLDQLTLIRLENPGIVQALHEAYTAPSPVAKEEDFNAKFDALRTLNPKASVAIESLRDDFRSAWGRSLSFDKALSEAVPHVHRSFENARRRIASEARMASLGSTVDPVQLVRDVTDRMARALRELPTAAILEGEIDDLAMAETGRLIGECPLDWRNSE